MLRIESHTILDGLAVIVVGLCLTAHEDGGRHGGMRVSTVLSASAIEHGRLDDLVVIAVTGLLRENPDLAELILC